MKKLVSIFNYIGATILLLLAFIGGVTLFPIVYWLKESKLREKYPFWWWFDDEDGLYGADYWRNAKNIVKNNFWVSYRWCGLRNPMWNAHTKIKPISGKEVVIYEAGRLTRDGGEVSLSNSATMNYEDANGNYQGNAGDIFSTYFSFIGWAFIWFTKEDKLYWRYSLVKRIYKKIWIEVQIGVFHRYIFKIKLKLS